MKNFNYKELYNFFPILLTIPLSLILGLNIINQKEMFWFSRSLIHILALTLCFVPFFTAHFIKNSHPKVSTYILLSANLIRLIGFLFILAFYYLLNLPNKFDALIIYSITIGSFLLFQIITMLRLKQKKY